MTKLGHCLPLLLAAGAVMLLPHPATAQRSCKNERFDEWRTPESVEARLSKLPWADVPQHLVLKVDRSVDEARARLSQRSFTRLAESEVVHFVTSPPKMKKGLAPYLVRGVRPNGGAQFSAGWLGENLSVFAGTLGCVADTKQPLVIFLPRPPKSVIVSAMSAL